MKKTTLTKGAGLPVSRTVAMAVGLALAGVGFQAQASSHREAPFIAMQPAVDGTDFYMFDPDARYAINIDNHGSGQPDLSFVFRFKNTSKMQALDVGGKKVKIPLINSGTIPPQVNPPTLNVRETYTVALLRHEGDDRYQSPIAVDADDPRNLRNAETGSTQFDKPVDNVGGDDHLAA